jgi:hypothetical protein
VGVWLTTADVNELAERLTAALADPAPKARYQAEILRCARAEFDADRMRTALYAGFQTCAAVTRR